MPGHRHHPGAQLAQPETVNMTVLGVSPEQQQVIVAIDYQSGQMVHRLVCLMEQEEDGTAQIAQVLQEQIHTPQGVMVINHAQLQAGKGANTAELNADSGEELDAGDKPVIQADSGAPQAESEEVVVAAEPVAAAEGKPQESRWGRFKKGVGNFFARFRRNRGEKPAVGTPEEPAVISMQQENEQPKLAA